MKKHLKLQIVAEGPTFVRFRISEQTHRGDMFGEWGRSSYMTGGGILMSSSCPAVQLNEDETFFRLFVQGSYHNNDNNEMEVGRSVFESILKTVEAYNKSFGTGNRPSVEYAERLDTKSIVKGSKVKKYIKLYVEEQTDEIVRFYIDEQTHCLEEFGKDSDQFKASNGINLISELYPSVVIGIDKTVPIAFFVCGSDSSLDRISMLTSQRTFNKIAAAVREYNKAFGSEDVIAVSYEDSANPVKEPAAGEIQVYRAIVEKGPEGHPGCMIWDIGADTYEEALEILGKEGIGSITIECLPQTVVAKERGILHRSVFDQLVRRGIPRQDQNKA